MNRRKTKTERELVADVYKKSMQFCNENTCRNCPLKEIKERYNLGCTISYLIYLMEADIDED